MFTEYGGWVPEICTWAEKEVGRCTSCLYVHIERKREDEVSMYMWSMRERERHTCSIWGCP